MDLRLLGPVEIVVDDQVLDIGPPQQRLVLAVLAADAGRLVGTESLIDRVWDDVQPEYPRRALQVYISRIRRLPVKVVRRSGGYLLDIDTDRVDVHRFQRLVDQARNRECPEAERVALLGQALELWRGLPLADLPGHWATRVRLGWQQQYLEAVVAWALASLRAGDPGAVVARLRELVGEHPLVESLAAVYMRALYGAGRPADALDHYAAIRHRLVEELGADPGPELQRLHRQILSGDPALTSPATSAPPARQVVPRQLPAPPQMFTGRVGELAGFDQSADESIVVITAIDGMAGVGKTALALQAAHRIAESYPDGQLFIDLHGHTQGMEPTEPADALDQALRALGVPGAQIPVGTDQRAALYRTRLADRRVLIVLDNAATEAQVVPLLPGAPGCLALVTSRRRLAGLDHTRTLSLDTLPVPDAVTLFIQTAGDGRLAGQPTDLLAELVELCGRLPLAIRIAAARLRSHPTWTLTHLVERLRDQRHRLTELEAGHRSVTAALDLSYQHLGPELQRTYRLLGLHPGADIDAYATAALLDSSLPHAQRMLDRLLEAHLLLEPVPGRHRFHDLTRVHAAHTATGEPAGHAGLDRLLDYYLYTASLAMDVAFPYERERRPSVPSARTPVPDLPDPARALDWLDSELPNLLAAARHAADHGRPSHIVHLSTVLHRHLRTRGRYHEAETLHHRALSIARATGHETGELDALTGLAWVRWLQGRNEQAADQYQHALRLARANGHRTSELKALNGLGWVHVLQGEYDPAADYYRQLLALAQETGDRTGELEARNGLGQIDALQGRYEQAADHLERALTLARITAHHPGELDALNGLGQVNVLQGRYEQAAEHLERALTLARVTGYRTGELNTLNGLGHLHRRRGRYARATDHYQQALEIARVTGHRTGELNALNGLGDVHRVQGRHARAAGYYQQLLVLAEENGDRNFEYEAWLGLGRLQHDTGNPEPAITHHRRALALAGEMGQPDDEARAHDGLAQAHLALDEYEQAREHWQHALDILTRLGVGHTYDEETTVAAIRGHLADLGATLAER